MIEHGVVIYLVKTKEFLILCGLMHNKTGKTVMRRTYSTPCPKNGTLKFPVGTSYTLPGRVGFKDLVHDIANKNNFISGSQTEVLSQTD